MKRLIGLSLVLSLAAVALAATPVSAALISEDLTTPVNAGHATITWGSETSLWHIGDATPRAGAANDRYKNSAATPIGAFSSTSLTSVWGDRVTTTGTGILDEMDFTIYNSSSSAGTLLTASFGLNIFNGTTLAPIGGFNTTTVSFGAGLGLNAFSVITVTGLSALNINLNTTDLILTQTVLAKTGAANRLGIVFMDPPSVGSSTNTFYANSATVGPAGFYNVGNPAINANPGYRVNIPEPGTLALLGMGVPFVLRRRK